jgi:putative two-component system response regulator
LKNPHSDSGTTRGPMPKHPIVDDIAENLVVLGDLLRSAGYRVKAANSGRTALRYARREPLPQLILLDVLMPEMDGHQVLGELKRDPQTCDIPVLFLTALSEPEDEERGLALGAADYISKPIKPNLVLARVRAHLQAKQARDWLRDRNQWLENEVNRRMEENNLIQVASIRALAHLAETRDPETGNHILRTQGYVKKLAEVLTDHSEFNATLTPHYIDMLTLSAPLHDIGKVGIPDQILLKPGKLTAQEWVIMQTHAPLGAEAIEQAESDIDRPLEFLALAKEVTRWHHERWNGKGYPDGLSGKDIPVSARLMALADVFDALISPRVYKAPMDFATAREIIAEGCGNHFDPVATDAFLRNYDVFVKIARDYGEQ